MRDVIFLLVLLAGGLWAGRDSRAGGGWGGNGDTWQKYGVVGLTK